MSLLQIENLSKRFTLHNLDGKDIQGFGTLSFNVSQGQLLALSGPSGAGKSSVLKCIYRTYLPSDGRILYHSERDGILDLSALSEHEMIRLRRSEIGYVSQFLNVIPRVTASDVVAEPLVMRGVSIKRARERAKTLLTQLNIPCRLHDAYPVTFSGGEQQRVNLARAIIAKPRLLLLDEPTASLDNVSVQNVLAMMDELRAQGTTIIMICHDKKVVKKMADKIIPMSVKPSEIELNSQTANKPPKNNLIIAGGNLVLHDRIEENTDVVIMDGRIEHIGARPETLPPMPVIDAKNLWVLPGFIDLHSDAIEKAIEPRPRAILPLEIALTELDKSLAASGITTMHHCVCFTAREENELRYYQRSAELVRNIRRLAPEMLVRTRIHARYEMLEAEAVETIAELLADNLLDLVSLMDHTPGQGQFREVDYLYEYYTKSANMTHDQVDEMIERRITRRRNFDDAHVRELVQQCMKQSIPVASHDDDTAQKVEWVNGMGVQISEFPVTLEAAHAAKSCGMNVLMGAPNIIFGKSLSDNLSGREAITQNCCDLIGSDYSPSSLLHSIFKLYQLNLGTLPELIRMTTHHPAKVIGQDHRIGSIATGFDADLFLVDTKGHAPRVMQTFVGGRQVYACR